MKIRNHRRIEWWFFPREDSKLNKGRRFRFKYKIDLMNFLTSNLMETINGRVELYESHFGGSGCLRQWNVWYNDKSHCNRLRAMADLRQLTFRNKKFVFFKDKVSKEDKKYYAFSEKVISYMGYLSDKDEITKQNAEKLVNLFKKRGFKDFEPSEEDLLYINGHISDGIQFGYWSDRCNWLRTKTIIEYFKRRNLI